MSADMQITRRGRKHRCAACGAAFYDLERNLDACPKCETPYAAAGQMPRGEPARKRQSWSRSARPAEPEAEPGAPAGAAADAGDVPLLDSAEEADEADEATEEGANEDAEEREAPDEDQG